MAGYLDTIAGTIPLLGQISASEWQQPGGPFVMADFASTVGGVSDHRVSQRSPGASLVAPIQFQQPPNEVWEVTSWAITITLAAAQWQDLETVIGPTYYNPYPSFGKLGSITAGLWAAASQDTINAISNQVQPNLPLPPDATLLSTIFDPAADPLPPVNFVKTAPGGIYTNVFNTLSLSAQGTPSTPLDVTKKAPIAVILTMFPSLVQNLELWVMSMEYAIGISSTYVNPENR